jgi:hypothetical protein
VVPTHCSTSSSVLGGSTSNIGHSIVLNEFIVASSDGIKRRRRRKLEQIVHSCMLFPSQDGIVCFQIVFLEKFVPIPDLHIEQGVSHAKK